MIKYSKFFNKWILFTQKGKRILGMHLTKEKALKQERAIQVSKRIKR